MSNSNPSLDDERFLRRAMEATVRIGVLVLLVAWCFRIIQPFFIAIVWGMIIAVASVPGYRWLETRLGGRANLAAILATLLLLTILVVPTVMLSDTLVESVTALSQQLTAGTLSIPPPPEVVAGWPVIGKSLAAFWQLASTNLQAALEQIAPHLRAAGTWLLSAAAGVGFGILQFVAAIIIAGLFLAHSASGERYALAIATRLAGKRGQEFANLAEETVRSVARGILGVAFIQAVAAGLGFLMVGLPGAGFWALLCLLFSTIQLGVGLVTIPAAIYVMYTADPLPAVIFLIWSILVTLLDNLLKPVLLGRGVNIPMVVIFVGAIGGFITSGIIGLFTGAVVLVLGFKLFVAWLHEDTGAREEEASASVSRQPSAS
jgi:predicted PurR-regulated permease PerM